MVLLFSNLLATHPAGMGFDFIVIVPLLSSFCGFLFVSGHGISFLIGSRDLLAMVVQQLVVVMMFSQEEMSLLLLCHLEPEALPP